MEVIQVERQLNDAIRSMGGSLLHLTIEEFTAWANNLGKEELELLLERHRATRNFYKKIMLEDRRKEYPNSHRYADAENKLRIYNDQGKALSEIVKSK